MKRSKKKPAKKSASEKPAKKKPAAKPVPGPTKSRSRGRSCYAFELSIDPGGGRRGEVYVYNRFEHIRRILEQEFFADRVGFAAYFAVWYGERILLWVIQGGRIVEAVDLHPFIRFHGFGLEGVALDDAATLAPIREQQDSGEAVLGDNPPVRFEIDWDALAARVPALEGEPLRAGQTVAVKGGAALIKSFGSYLDVSDEALAYGYNDLESGEEPPADWEDPDPQSRYDDD